jgi:hypothetical protein
MVPIPLVVAPSCLSSPLPRSQLAAAVKRIALMNEVAKTNERLQHRRQSFVSLEPSRERRRSQAGVSVKFESVRGEVAPSALPSAIRFLSPSTHTHPCTLRPLALFSPCVTLRNTRCLLLKAATPPTHPRGVGRHARTATTVATARVAPCSIVSSASLTSPHHSLPLPPPLSPSYSAGRRVPSGRGRGPCTVPIPRQPPAPAPVHHRPGARGQPGPQLD